MVGYFYEFEFFVILRDQRYIIIIFNARNVDDFQIFTRR